MDEKMARTLSFIFDSSFYISPAFPISHALPNSLKVFSLTL